MLTQQRNDLRASSARYYDLFPPTFDDVAFYRNQLTRQDMQVLELGSGSGRVLADLADDCGYIHGLDRSEAMVARCRRLLEARGVPTSQAYAEVGDIADFVLGMSFDLIIAPFRVMQCLTRPDEIDGLLESVRMHLAPGGRCILNAFRPMADRAGMLAGWVRPEERQVGEVLTVNGRVRRFETRDAIEREPMVIYPELIYRTYREEQLVHQARLPLAMRVWYADELIEAVESRGFRVTNAWGGYDGEAYGEGPELVVAFEA